MDNTGKLQKIADGLNAPPYGKRLTLVSLTEILQDPLKAVPLLQEVAETVKPRPLSDEEPYPKTTTTEELVAQITEYAACVCFNVEGGVTFDKASFSQKLLLPNSPELLDLLYSILVDLRAAKQKTYLARYKAPVIIPNDIQQNDEIQKLLQQLRAAQQKFQQSFEENTGILQQQVTTKIDQLQTEKTQLIARQDKLVERIRQVKLQPVQDEAVALSKRRREAHSEIETLKQQSTQQNDLRKAYLQRAQAVVNSAKGTPAGIIEACQVENKRVKQELINLPQEIAEKESLKELIVQDPNDEIIIQMEQDLENSKKELLRLKELNNITGDQPDQQESQVIYLRQNLAKFKRKHQELSQRYEKTQQDSAQIDTKMKSMMQNNVNLDSIEQMEEMPLIVFKDLVGKGKAMKPQMTRCSEERRYLQKELAILTRTVEILTQICVNYGQNVTENPEQMMNTQNLHEARALLAEIETTIKQKRAYIQPKMTELSNAKRQQQNLESMLQQQRQKVKQLDASKQGSIYKLKMTLQRAENECQSVISEIFRVEKQSHMFTYELERVEKDKDFNQLKKDIMLEQNEIKVKQAELRQKQSEVKDNLPQLLEQKKMFADLVKLLNAKTESVKRMKEEIGNTGDDRITLK
ncbi:Intraflagellar_transport protein 81 [Hexamita inflata]|uniref:Intraflagellar transport protein 81 n=1 Tax=Hexamita inflata TaxID=28002 RepID=A0AA86P3M5_9EUKA|nr:Intraflagellar transport protein 81 [Hexamita inflata]CAI9941295.1 Intraflagellar transport protein 81 [Hexamita inflata]CAI9970247.1 Intraflagellar transport protein 81 [Hexamita inflata]